MRINKINDILNNTKEYIKNPGYSNFNDIALDLYDLHRLHNKNYKKYSIGKLDDWHDIPLVPSYEFSKRKLQLDNFNGFDPTNEVEFISRGTKPKHHVLRDTEFLRSAITSNFQFGATDLNQSNKIVFLNNKKPHALVSYINEYVSSINDFRGIYEYVDPNDKKSVEEFITAQSLEQYVAPLLIIGTPNQFYQFKLTVDSLDANPIIQSPFGYTMIIQFGDYLEEPRMDVTYYELNDWLSHFFNTSSINRIVQVYYKTELSSQLFRWGERLTSYVPHTISVRVLDPDTGKELPPGVEGNLAFIDIANVWSCPFIISDDLGIMYDVPQQVQITRKSNEIIKTGVNPKQNYYV